MSLPLPSYSSRTEAVISNDIGSGPIITGYAYISTQLAHTPFILMVVKQKQGMLGPWQELRSKITWFVGCGILIVILVMTLTCTYMVNRLYQADTAKAETMALMEQNNQLVSMGQLAAGVAHEINNPLALINETAGYIKDLFVIKHQYKDDKELLENIDAIIDAVDRCGTITKQLLGFTRKFDPKIQQVDLARLISEVLAFHKKEAEYRNIEVYVDVEGDISGLETDQGKLQQILVNLVNNAFQAMDDGCILEVRAAAEEADQVRLTISDNGCGMPEDTLPKIFEPFFTTKEKDQGTGLGLAITYGLVTKLHGKIAVESRENEGTTFVVTLPKQFKEETRENESSSG
jgi:signal transduction histidine kinase